VADGSLEELRGQAHQTGAATLEDVFLKLTTEAAESPLTEDKTEADS
jgi:hypothetical protein